MDINLYLRVFNSSERNERLRYRVEHKQVCEQCAKSNRVLGFVRRNTRSIKSASVRSVIYLTLVRSHLGYATQVWVPQSKELIRKTEQIQRRATKYILNLPFLCEESYKDRLIKLDLLPVSYWHEYLDMVFFFKSVTGLVKVKVGVALTLLEFTLDIKSVIACLRQVRSFCRNQT